jgi:transcriptional regulator with XRE-family HTH domain
MVGLIIPCKNTGYHANQDRSAVACKKAAADDGTQSLRAEAVSRSAEIGGVARYGRGTGVPDPVDVHVGARIRTRRLLIGMNQETLANALGLTFQQVQKYEGGANRVSASRLSQIADVLGVPISYFFSDLDPAGAGATDSEVAAREMMQRPEAIELIRWYYAIPDQQLRQQFLDMVKAVAQSQQAQP